MAWTDRKGLRAPASSARPISIQRSSTSPSLPVVPAAPCRAGRAVCPTTSCGRSSRSCLRWATRRGRRRGSETLRAAHVALEQQGEAEAGHAPRGGVWPSGSGHEKSVEQRDPGDEAHDCAGEVCAPGPHEEPDGVADPREEAQVERGAGASARERRYSVYEGRREEQERPEIPDLGQALLLRRVGQPDEI